MTPYPAPLVRPGSDGQPLGRQRVTVVRVYWFAAFYEANGASARILKG